MKITSNKKGAFALGALINKTKADIIKYCGEPTGPFKEWHGGGGYNWRSASNHNVLISLKENLREIWRANSWNGTNHFNDFKKYCFIAKIYLTFYFLIIPLLINKYRPLQVTWTAGSGCMYFYTWKFYNPLKVYLNFSDCNFPKSYHYKSDKWIWQKDFELPYLPVHPYIVQIK